MAKSRARDRFRGGARLCEPQQFGQPERSQRQLMRPPISGVTLHSYRCAWAERSKTVGYPERFAQEALGHNSKAVHRAYAKGALIKISSLEEYEKDAAKVEPPV
jgi:hypothetical protein